MTSNQTNQVSEPNKTDDRREYQRKYYQKHREKMLQYQRDYSRRFKRKIKISSMGDFGHRQVIKSTLTMCDIMRANPEKVVVMVNNIIRGDRMFVSL